MFKVGDVIQHEGNKNLIVEVIGVHSDRYWLRTLQSNSYFTDVKHIVEDQYKLKPKELEVGKTYKRRYSPVAHTFKIIAREVTQNSAAVAYACYKDGEFTAFGNASEYYLMQQLECP